MANIISKEKCIVIDGASIPLNSMTCSEITNGAMLSFLSGTGNIRLMVNETTLDGNPVSNRDELISYLQENCFNLGGNGTSEGVQSISGSSVDNTDPKNPIVNSTSVSWSEINDKPLIVAEGNTEEAARAAIGAGRSNLEIGTTSGTAKSGDYTPTVSDVTGLSAQLLNKENKSEKGQALGYTPLDASGLVPLEHLNVSGLQFKGGWNPNTNTPTIVDGTGSVGDFYKASEAGSFNSGNGNFTYAVGDWVIFAGGIWQRLGSTELVASVNGKLGMVVISKSDIGLGNADNTSDANKPISTATATALSGKASSSHTHTIANVTNLQSSLDAKTSKAYVDGGDVTLITQFTPVSSTQTITVTIPDTAPNLLRFELFIPDTIVGTWIGLRINGNTSSVYKSVLQNVNSVTYGINRHVNQDQLRVMTGAAGAFPGRYNVRIEGTITNVAGQVKITNGTAYIAGSLVSDQPDINNFFGSAHGTTLNANKITEMQFRTNPASGGFTLGSVLSIYGIK